MHSPKLTPTFNDKAKEGDQVEIGPNPKITEAHEPLAEGGWNVSESTRVVLDAPLPEPAKQPAKTNGEAKPLKVALIGTAPSSRALAPFNNPEWQIWGCSPGNMGQLPSCDVWFELHSNLLWPENRHYGEPYVNWMKMLKIPLFMQDKVLCPNATVFPVQDVVREFGNCFFTSSFAWMMAWAMMQGAKEVALFGIDMASRDEYVQQRQGAYYFFMEGARRGIKMWAPAESDIMQPPPLYGYAETTPYGRKMHARKKEIADRIAGMEVEVAKMRDNITYLKGAQEDNDYQISIWGGAQQR